MNSTIEKFRGEMRECLDENILKFWSEKMRDLSGGFFGEMTSNGAINRDSSRGAILTARILWSFSAAYNLTKNEEYLECALSAKDYLLKYLYDSDFGGVIWEVKSGGEPLDTKKQFYALGFAIYALSELSRASGDTEALDYAIKLYHTIEEHSFNDTYGGYIEACTKEWGEIEDMRLSEKDENYPLTMNTHLHILEPYTALYRVWRDEGLKGRIVNLLDIFCTKMLNTSNNHLGLFFDTQWHRSSDVISYGHDIEASWLMLEAALEIDDREVLERVKPITYKIAIAALKGLQSDGSMIYERDGSHTDTDRHWWVQAETIVGLVWLYKHHNYPEGLTLALKCWDYTKEHLIDSVGGEWWWRCNERGEVNMEEVKAGFWKCPYHNSRMCIEVIVNCEL